MHYPADSLRPFIITRAIQVIILLERQCKGKKYVQLFLFLLSIHSTTMILRKCAHASDILASSRKIFATGNSVDT
jgi:hypothetical protein